MTEKILTCLEIGCWAEWWEEPEWRPGCRPQPDWRWRCWWWSGAGGSCRWQRRPGCCSRWTERRPRRKRRRGSPPSPGTVSGTARVYPWRQSLCPQSRSWCRWASLLRWDPPLLPWPSFGAPELFEQMTSQETREFVSQVVSCGGDKESF